MSDYLIWLIVALVILGCEIAIERMQYIGFCREI